MRTFDPRTVAHDETGAWVAYYERRWPALLRCLLSLSRGAFGLTLPQAIVASYYATRAQVAFAPFPNNNVPKALRYQRRFYDCVKGIHPTEPFDPARAAELDVGWWVVHRELFANPANGPLIDALADLYVETYRVSRGRVLEAARLRAEAMQYSDRWVRSGHPAGSPLMIEAEAALLKSYSALKQVVFIFSGETPPAEPGVSLPN